MEFQIKKEMLEDRVADFYTRLILLERESRAREQGAEEMRKQRAKFKQEYEAARREYIQQRQAKREPDPSAHEKELREQRERYERARRDYVRRRDEMRRFEKSVGGIPEYVEYDIDLDPLTETE